jgi:hypothetical protein
VRSMLVAASLGLAVGVLGCSGGSGADSSRPPGPEPSSPPTSAVVAEPAPRGAVPERLRVALPTAGARRAHDIVIDLTEAAAAPTVDQAPVGEGMLLAQLSLWSTDVVTHETVDPGQPYLMTRKGGWRRFDLPRYGFGPTVYGELSMAISSDGRRVAFADPSGLVALDLRDNTFKRFELPVREAIALEWSSDGATLLLKDRHSNRRPCGPKGCVLDVATGRLTAVPFNLFFSARGHDREVFELKAAPSGIVDHLVRHRDGLPPARTPLQYASSVSTAGGPAAADDVAYTQCAEFGGVQGPPGSRVHGVIVADAGSGRAVSMLVPDGSRRSCRLGAELWLTGRHLLVSDWVRGDLWLWDVPRQRVRRVGTARTSGVNVSVAAEVMAGRFGQLLR